MISPKKIRKSAGHLLLSWLSFPSLIRQEQRRRNDRVHQTGGAAEGEIRLLTWCGSRKLAASCDRGHWVFGTLPAPVELPSFHLKPCRRLHGGPNIVLKRFPTGGLTAGQIISSFCITQSCHFNIKEPLTEVSSTCWLFYLVWIHCFQLLGLFHESNNKVVISNNKLLITPSKVV